MDGFFNAFKSSGIVKVVQDVAEDALHVNRDGKVGNVDSKSRSYDSSSTDWPTPGESEADETRYSRHSRNDDDQSSQSSWGQPARNGQDESSESNWQRPRPTRNEEDETSQPEWRRPRPGRDEEDQETQPKWGSSRPEREDNRPSEGSWAKVASTHGDDNQDDGWQTAGRTRAGGRQHRPHIRPSEEQFNEYQRDPSEQNYAEEASVDIEPTEEELNDLSVAANRLWDLDLNRLVPGQDYEIDCGEGKKLYNKEDMSVNSLFKFMDKGVFKRPTFARFYQLLDNYNSDESKREEMSAAEEREQMVFLEEISRTAPIKYLLRYLAEKRIVSNSMEEFKQIFRNLWFEFYNRGGTQDSSSAFEHVFVGEVKRRGEVSGFHNWIQFYMKEAKGTVDYQGYIFPRRRGGDLPDSQSQLMTIQFDWNGVRKEQSSVMIGVSPEFELALYTLCFFCGQEENHVNLGPYRVNVKCYHIGEDRIGSVFPIALD